MSDPGSGLGGSDPTPPLQGRRPTEESDFYTQWARENAKEFFKNANTTLGQLLTLSTALLGGSIAFWPNIPIATPYRMLVVVALLVTVLICVFSVIPREGRMDPRNPDDIKRHMDEVAAYKLRRLRLAKAAIVTALVIMVGSLLITGTAADAAIRELATKIFG
jgi:uncharacterized membrane protein